MHKAYFLLPDQTVRKDAHPSIILPEKLSKNERNPTNQMVERRILQDHLITPLLLLQPMNPSEEFRVISVNRQPSRRSFLHGRWPLAVIRWDPSVEGLAVFVTCGWPLATADYLYIINLLLTCLLIEYLDFLLTHYPG